MGSSYPCHLTSSSLLKPRPRGRFSALRIRSIRYSSSRSFVAGGGCSSRICCDGKGSIAALFKRPTWKCGQMPDGTSSSTACGYIILVIRYLALSQDNFFESWGVSMFLSLSQTRSPTSNLSAACLFLLAECSIRCWAEAIAAWANSWAS